MEQLEEELTCPICYDTFVEPRVLPCSHTFCGPCLRDLLQPGPGFSCPSCRALVAVPAAGLEALPINFALKAVIEKCQQEERAPGMCRAHPRQPLNIYCLQDRRLVCGQCLTVGKHRGHAIDDLQSAYRKAREALGQLLGELADPSRSEVFSCSERLQQQKARCQSTLQGDREAVLKYFKELGDVLENKKAALLSALDELDSHILEKYDPLIEEVKFEECELMELHSALQEEESPLLFLEKMNELQPRLHALKLRQLPEPEPVEIHPRMKNVLQDMSATEIGQVHRIRTPKLHLAHESQRCGKQIASKRGDAVAALMLILIGLALLWQKEPQGLVLLMVSFVLLIVSGIIPVPLARLWEFLLWIYQDSCTYLQARMQDNSSQLL
ncbi:tripartite motif-containing protein 59 [Vidua macroura]|uniref:tripartite motif-containing protein 59 n=1 Tax=Vidua macroura TaxID=187451 RepID=UPI0023A80EC4|nr:tripartite motif-containing protein 59 [Vidua macroura]